MTFWPRFSIFRNDSGNRVSEVARPIPARQVCLLRLHGVMTMPSGSASEGNLVTTQVPLVSSSVNVHDIECLLPYTCI